MKLLSVTIPCYNSAEYMENAIKSAVAGGEDIEILVVNDGSNDNTANIADEYSKRYPGIVRAIHKKNGGHGSAVNTGIANAKGLYFKVLDSDDWFDEDSLLKVMDFLRKVVTDSIPLDMLIWTKLLRDCKLKLPEHTFYVDNIYAYKPLPYVKCMYYMDTNLYRYYIGRSDQSVNEVVMTKRIDQQIKVTKLMIDCHNPLKIKNKKLAQRRCSGLCRTSK